MTLLRVELRYNVNRHLPVQPEEVLSSYLSSFTLFSDNHIRSIHLQTIEEWIDACFLELEQKLVTLFFIQGYRDNTEYRNANTRGHIHIDVRFPVRSVRRISIKIGTQRVLYLVDIPNEVVGFRHDSGRFTTPIRRIDLVPYLFGNLRGIGSRYGLGISTSLYATGRNSQPNFWDSLYLTGFRKIPADVRDYIKLEVASRAVVAIGDSVFGPGVSGYSLSTEGLSQSISSARGMDGGGVFSSTINGWKRQLDSKYKNLYRAYSGARIYA